MPAPRNDALARFVLTPTRATNGKSLDQHWDDLARFMRGPGSALARWLAIGQMHAVYKRMKRDKVKDPARLGSLTMRHFVERAVNATGVSRPTIYRYVERSEALVERIGPSMLKTMLSGDQPIVNDEDILLKVAQLPPEKALMVVRTYLRGGKSQAAAARLVERYLHGHRLSGLTTAHEPQLRGGSFVDGVSPAEMEKLAERNVVFFGDALLVLQESLCPESVQTCVSSPPFFGQRDFGTRHWFGGDHRCKHDRKVAHGSFHAGQVPQTKYQTPKASQNGQTAITHSCSRCGSWNGQIGQEPDVAMYIDHVVAIFREVRRVLRADGVCWIEIGDTYNAYNGNRGPSASISGRADRARPRWDRGHGLTVSDLPNKSLLLVPQRLAVALQEDGWVVRAEVIWRKLAALPESVTDRPIRSHTTILMLARSADYFYDATAILEPTTGAGIRAKGLGRKETGRGSGSFRVPRMQFRNRRDIWSFVAGKFPDAHTATFPEALPERCILASTSEKGACAGCGAPWRRRVFRGKAGGSGSATGSDAIPPPETLGWEPTCDCGIADVAPCLVLDPFAGSGTTLKVAKQLGRDYVGIEINEREYGPLIQRRLREAVVERAEGHPARTGTRRRSP